MKKTYQIEVDCANCANLMEEATKKTEGVQDAVVNFMTQKLIVEFAEVDDLPDPLVSAPQILNLRLTILEIHLFAPCLHPSLSSRTFVSNVPYPLAAVNPRHWIPAPPLPSPHPLLAPSLSSPAH